MHFLVQSICYYLLSIVIAQVSGLPILPTSATVESIQSFVDPVNSQASFIVPLISNFPTTDLTLDLSILPSVIPCDSNIHINGVALNSTSSTTSTIKFEPQFQYGSSNIIADGNEIAFSWYSACNSSQQDPFSANLLTITIDTVNGQSSLSKQSGFTLSFKDINTPTLLRYIQTPVSPVELRPILWTPSNNHGVEDIKIEELKTTIADLEHQLEILQGSPYRCGSALRHIKSFFTHLHNKLHTYFSHSTVDTPRLIHSQKPTIMQSTDEKKSPIAYPPQCHCADGEPSEPPPPPYTADDSSYLSPSSPSSNSSSHDVPNPTTSQSPSNLNMFLRVLLVVTGLGFIFAVVRQCFQSPRKRRERAAQQEERDREKQYRKASRQQAIRDWFRGRPRGTPGRRVGDLEEKARLAGMQEDRLEAWMQAEIRHFQGRDEIGEIRNARNVVDQLIAAEEGRCGTSQQLPPYSPTVPGTSHHGPISSTYIYRSTSRPAPINIPGRTRNYSSANSSTGSPISSDSLPPFSPMSRTTSLPSYRSKPPSYRDETSDGEALSSHYYLSDCDLSADDERSEQGDDQSNSRWAADSSIPDISPRVSLSTARTFL